MPRKEIFSALCSKCGRTFEVPFKSDPNMPIYCQHCWLEKKENEWYSTRKDKWAWEGLMILSIIYGLVVGIFLDLWMGVPAGGMYIIAFFTSSLTSILVFASAGKHRSKIRMTKLRLTRSLLGMHVGISVAFAVWYYLGWPFLSSGGNSPVPIYYVWLFIGLLAGLPLDFACVGVGLAAFVSLDYVVRKITKDRDTERITQEASPPQENGPQETGPSREKKPTSERGYLV